MSADVTTVQEPRVHRWEQRSEWPLTAAAAVFFVAYAWPILQPGLPKFWHDSCRLVNYITWVIFAADFVVRVGLARYRARYVSRHLPDLAVVALPIFRPLRLLRLVLLLKVLNRQASDSFRGRVVVYVIGSALVLNVCAALAVLDAERGHHGANINNFGDAIWWAFVTVCTVGYGDHFPVTIEGRFVAVGLMIGGIALIGVVTATFASWLIDRVRDVEVAEDINETAALRSEIRELRAEIGLLHTAITGLTGAGPL